VKIAIVAASEDLRAALASALRGNPAIEVVAVRATDDDIPQSADVVLVARDNQDAPIVRRPVARDRVMGTVLTNREQEILTLLADGLGNKQIAARLGISTNTVKTHLELLFEKLGVSSRAEAVANGVKRGLLHL
jgi:DNA-binding NarL/FixJ family response regulator